MCYNESWNGRQGWSTNKDDASRKHHEPVEPYNDVVPAYTIVLPAIKKIPRPILFDPQVVDEANDTSKDVPKGLIKPVASVREIDSGTRIWMDRSADN